MLLFYFKSPNTWIDVGEPPPYPEEIEYIYPPGVIPPKPVIPEVMALPLKPDYSQEDDDLLMLLMKLDKYDD